MLCIRPTGINNRACAFSSHILFRGDSQFLSSQIIMFSWTLSIFTQSQCFTFHLTLSAPCNYLEYRYSSWNIKRRIYRSPSHYLLDSHLCLNSSVLLSPSYSNHFSRSSLVISENFLSPVCECVCGGAGSWYSAHPKWPCILIILCSQALQRKLWDGSAEMTKWCLISHRFLLTLDRTYTCCLFAAIQWTLLPWYYKKALKVTLKRGCCF